MRQIWYTEARVAMKNVSLLSKIEINVSTSSGNLETMKEMQV